MRINKQITILCILIFSSSLIFGSLTSNEPILGMKNQDITDTNIDVNIFGTIDHSVEIFDDAFAMEYIDGSIYAVDGYGTFIRVYDAVTGESTDNITLPFGARGITTDGTYLYVSLYTITTPNGTIVKLDMSGNEISRFSIPIFSGLLGGLTFDGTYLWANEEYGYGLLQIDQNTGSVLKNITIDYVARDLTYYRNRLWVAAYSYDRVVSIDPLTGESLDYFDSPFHFDAGLACNSTHFMQSQYIDLPYFIAFYELPDEPGDIFTQSVNLMTNLMDITYVGDNDYIWFTENSTSYVYGLSDNFYSGMATWSVGAFVPVGITLIYDDFFLMSAKDAPYNLYTFTLDGTLLMNQTSEVDVMIRALEFDGTYVWAMGSDRILYKLDPVDMSIITQYALSGNVYGIAYDYDLDVLWALDRSDDTIKYLDMTTGEFGESMITLESPITPTERSIAYDGEFLIVSVYTAGSTYYKIIKGELDPVITPTPTPTPTNPSGLIPGVTPLIEDLIFLGIGAVSVSLIAIVIAIIVKAKK